MFKNFLKLINKVGKGKEHSKEEVIKEKSELVELDESLDADTNINITEKTSSIIDEEDDNLEVFVDTNDWEEIEDIEYINIIKIERGKTIKAIDVYSNKEFYFDTHEKCSKKLKIPVAYIKENLIHGYTDYFGEAINYLSSELSSKDIKEDDIGYLYNNKTPYEQYNALNDRIFSSKISEQKRDEILSNDKINSKKMHYIFECIDEEYDDYFEKYKSIIKRGGKKKIELLNTNKEVIDIFKSLDDCANYLSKDKDEVVEMLKYGNTKVGRYEIRYSLRNI